MDIAPQHEVRVGAFDIPRSWRIQRIFKSRGNSMVRQSVAGASRNDDCLVTPVAKRNFSFRIATIYPGH